MMKRLTVVAWSLPLLLVAVFWICEPAFGTEINAGGRYTCGISNTSLTIPQSRIITEAVLTIQKVTKLSENDSDALQVQWFSYVTTS